MSFILENNNKVALEKAQAAPGLYEVVLHNDDFTPLSFVVEILKRLFYFDHIRAKKIAHQAHTKGRAVCGVYNKETAEEKIRIAIEHARNHEHPLLWTMEAG